MHQSFVIKKVAVLGAGVMGAQIAAHTANAGIETLLFDLAATPQNPNQQVAQAIAQLAKLKPAPLAMARTAELIHGCNYDQHLSCLQSCDLVIEAIGERLDWKEALYAKIAPFLKEDVLLVSNTSGLSIRTLSEALPASQRSKFCGVHFFNPPRYMHLAELIPAPQTSAAQLDFLETWLTSYLGKGVVRAKDTPNFIANRIGVFSLLATLHHAEAMQLTPDEVDVLTGSLLGRPKSATFRTMDVVGLDTMQHVVTTMQQQLREDPWHSIFVLPSWLLSLVEQGHLGQKSGQGIYRKNGQEKEVFDPILKAYRVSDARVSPDVLEIMQAPAPERLQRLFASSDRQARFLAACFKDLFHYCAYHLADLAASVREVDLALRWGFGWGQGPFEIWQSAGVVMIKHQLQQAIMAGTTLSEAPLPAWLGHLNDFYTTEAAFSAEQNTYVAPQSLPVYQRQFFPTQVFGQRPFHPKIWYENEGVRLWELQDEIAVASFKSKANIINQSVLDGLEEALRLAEQQSQGLIIYQYDPQLFSSGADLRMVADLIQTKQMPVLEQRVLAFQQLAQRIKYSAIPIVAAVRGRALGGGCELMMHCHAVMAAFESYPGLVEAGVGLIPAGGGCKEMALRAASHAGQSDLMAWVKPIFERIATGFTAGSAPDAQQNGYLRNTDQWVMHTEEVLYAAAAKIRALNASNYVAPVSGRFQVVGREGHAILQAGLVNWLEGGFISQHDYFLANQLAWVLCGGDVNQGQLVDERWMLALERQAFMTLAATEQTKARIAHLLQTGKPLRN